MRHCWLIAILACAAFAQDADTYYVVFLRPDPARTTLAQGEGEKTQAAHMANIQKMAADGVLVAAGPFGDETRTISGVFVMKAKSLAEAKRIAESDPTVTNHRNVVDVHTWRGPKGIGEEYAKLHREKPDAPENMGVHPLVILTRGPAWDAAKMGAHRDFVVRMKNEGKLAAAGPVTGEDTVAGFLVFKRIPLADAEALVKTDPTIAAGILRAEFHKWYSADHVLPW
jgi:uncharacterized protein YciI